MNFDQSQPLNVRFPHVDTKWKATLRRRLLNWFDKHKRDLPWRRNRTLYRVWISEIMLQQTQVVTVIPYFNRFIQSFPTVQKLASANESKVLKHWEGLGYYRRARQLHQAAKMIVQIHDGQFPRNFDDVLALPGIGRYTAGAILSIALDQNHAILEGNTVRLYSRLLMLDGDPTQAANNKTLWQFGESILPRLRTGDFNQALMELGSEVCTPRDPACSDCPVMIGCPTHHADMQNSIPAKKSRPATTRLNMAAVVIKRGRKYLVKQYGPGERWAGLWDFVRFETESPKSKQSAKIVCKRALRLTGLEMDLDQPFIELNHTVTRYKICLQVYRTSQVTGKLKRSSGYSWVNKNLLEDLPLSITGRKIANAING